jgi:hypothetical protein
VKPRITTKQAPVRRSLGEGGSVIVLVMVTLLFTAAALVAFIDKAQNDLLADARSAEAARLRPDAYSALEVALSVLADFRAADNGLHHPNEGWSDPLDWAGWAPTDGYTVNVSFTDESGKMSLNHTTGTAMLRVFEAWNLDADDAQKLTDEIQSWMHTNYTPVTAMEPDYEQSALPYDPPQRAMRSISELAAIDGARDFFYTNGRPNAYWWRFYSDFSVFNFARPNINGANADVLTGLGQFSPDEQAQVVARLNGSLATTTLVHPWFTSATDLRTAISSQVGNPRDFAYTSAAIRILITVHDGASQFQLSAVVSPTQGGNTATAVMATATTVKANAAAAASGETVNTTATATGTEQTSTTANSTQTAAAAATSTTFPSGTNIRYPYTILEILENDAIPAPPPAPPAPTDGSAPPADTTAATDTGPINSYAPNPPPLPLPTSP